MILTLEPDLTSNLNIDIPVDRPTMMRHLTHMWSAQNQTILLTAISIVTDLGITGSGAADD